MALLRNIPLGRGLLDQVWTVSFRDGVFGFRMRFNRRMQSYVLSLFDSQGEALYEGFRLALNTDFLRILSADPELPPGALFALHVGRHEEEPTPDNIGTLVRLLYVDLAGP